MGGCYTRMRLYETLITRAPRELGGLKLVVGVEETVIMPGARRAAVPAGSARASAPREFLSSRLSHASACWSRCP